MNIKNLDIAQGRELCRTLGHHGMCKDLPEALDKLDLIEAMEKLNE